jgi:organic hydroperoxide reductase OsmC/OhrA
MAGNMSEPPESVKKAADMSSHSAVIRWQRGDARFTDNRYSRAHRWQFDGGAVVEASSSPHVVPLPFSNPAGVDPEEAFVASLSSCHMLWFLSIAAQQGFCIDAYEDAAEGVMGRDAAGRMAMLHVTLRPRVRCSGAKQPDAEELGAMHRAAHEQCFIANSVRTELRID